MQNLIKNKGQVFTPSYLVDIILDFCGYKGDFILQKHIIDNSCGDGAFITAIVHRYCKAFLSKSNNLEQLGEELQTYIHGIEIEDKAFHCCLKNLSNLISQYGLDDIKFDIQHADALCTTQYNQRMDFVVGNPPYVRVHNLAEKYEMVKRFSFAQGGMTDLYLVFYELGLKMLSNNGVLCYITPSSWLNSLAATNMRNYIYQTKNIRGVVDLGHFQPFKTTSYTMIVLLDKVGQHEEVDYYTYNASKNSPSFVTSISIKDICIQGCFYFSTHEKLHLLQEIINSSCLQKAVVKNGYATLCDKVFIGPKKFRKFVIPVVKASTAQKTEAFYPYDELGKPYPPEEIFRHKDVADFLLENRERLLKRKSEQGDSLWYLYGRTQGILDTYKKKYAVSSIIKDVKSIKIQCCPAGTGVYGGLYILTEVDEKLLVKVLLNEDFISYLQLLKAYKSGGYYTINSKQLEKYINYMINKYE